MTHMGLGNPCKFSFGSLPSPNHHSNFYVYQEAQISWWCYWGDGEAQRSKALRLGFPLFVFLSETQACLLGLGGAAIDVTARSDNGLYFFHPPCY